MALRRLPLGGWWMSSCENGCCWGISRKRTSPFFWLCGESVGKFPAAALAARFFIFIMRFWNRISVGLSAITRRIWRATCEYLFKIKHFCYTSLLNSKFDKILLLMDFKKLKCFPPNLTRIYPVKPRSRCWTLTASALPSRFTFWWICGSGELNSFDYFWSSSSLDLLRNGTNFVTALCCHWCWRSWLVSFAQNDSYLTETCSMDDACDEEYEIRYSEYLNMSDVRIRYMSV